MDLDELLEEIAHSQRNALNVGVRHGLSLAVAALDLSLLMDNPPTLAEIQTKLRNLSAGFQ